MCTTVLPPNRMNITNSGTHRPASHNTAPYHLDHFQLPFVGEWGRGEKHGNHYVTHDELYIIESSLGKTKTRKKSKLSKSFVELCSVGQVTWKEECYKPRQGGKFRLSFRLTPVSREKGVQTWKSKKDILHTNFFGW